VETVKRRSPGSQQQPEIVSDAELGIRLRRARLDHHLSLKAVEAATDGTIGAAILSAYERGDHAITMRRLCQLATLYGVPVTDLIEPNVETPPRSRVARAAHPGTEPVRLDLRRLEESRNKETEMIWQLAAEVRRWRTPQSGQSMAIRRDDLVTTAALLGESLEMLLQGLREAGAVCRPRGRPMGT
jgi:transcriptional regulator with XRE-family HTH domain